MESKRGRGRGSDDWGGEDWPGSDWERDERTPSGRVTGPGGRPRDRPAPRGEVEIDGDLGRVVDDPLFDALPGGVPVRESIRVGGRRGIGAMTGRRAPWGMSLGQKILLWIGFAGVAAASFAAGLVVGASGGMELPGLAFLRPKESETVAMKPLGVEETSQSEEGVIAFSDHGQVPPKLDEGAEAPSAKSEPAPAQTVSTEAKEAKPPKAEKPAPKPTAEKKLEQVPQAATEKPANGSEKESTDMTFYDTATGQREVPGLVAPSEPVDSEAGPETVEPAGDAGAAPLGADVLARRRAEQAAPPPPARAPEATAPLNTREGETEGTPSGAELLARHRATHALPADESAAPPTSNIYSVQVATLADRSAARSLAERLSRKGFDVRIDSLSGATGTTLYVIRVGRYGSEAQAQQDLDRLKDEPDTHPFVKMN